LTSTPRIITLNMSHGENALDQQLDLFGQPEDPSLLVLSFGKHRGTPIRFVPGDYLQWLAREARDRVVRRAAAAELDRRAEPCGCAAPAASTPAPAAPAPADDGALQDSVGRARQCLAAAAERITELVSRLDTGTWFDGAPLDPQLVFSVTAGAIAAYANLDTDNITNRAARARVGRQPLGVIGGQPQ
jgi:hypothetical protein